MAPEYLVPVYTADGRSYEAQPLEQSAQDAAQTEIAAHDADGSAHGFIPIQVLTVTGPESYVAGGWDVATNSSAPQGAIAQLRTRTGTLVNYQVSIVPGTSKITVKAWLAQDTVPQSVGTTLQNLPSGVTQADAITSSELTDIAHQHNAGAITVNANNGTVSPTAGVGGAVAGNHQHTATQNPTASAGGSHQHTLAKAYRHGHLVTNSSNQGTVTEVPQGTNLSGLVWTVVVFG